MLYLMLLKVKMANTVREDQVIAGVMVHFPCQFD